MEGIQIPYDFFILFFSKDIFRSLPFILNFSFGLAIAIWQHQLKLTRQDIAALVSGFHSRGYKYIFLFYTTVVVVSNALCLFFIYPSMTYKIETELYPKILHNTMIALPAKQAFQIDDNHIFYFDAVNNDAQTQARVYEGIKILNLESQEQPLLVSAAKGSFYQDENTLFLEDGHLSQLSQNTKVSSVMNFNLLEYKISTQQYHISYHSLSLRQLLADPSPLNQGHLFWKLYLSLIPLLLLTVLSNQSMNIKFSGSFNLEIALVTAYYLVVIIIGLVTTKFIQTSSIGLIISSMLSLFVLSLFFRKLYAHVVK